MKKIFVVIVFMISGIYAFGQAGGEMLSKILDSMRKINVNTLVVGGIEKTHQPVGYRVYHKDSVPTMFKILSEFINSTDPITSAAILTKTVEGDEISIPYHFDSSIYAPPPSYIDLIEWYVNGMSRDTIKGWEITYEKVMEIDGDCANYVYNVIQKKIIQNEVFLPIYIYRLGIGFPCNGEGFMINIWTTDEEMQRRSKELKKRDNL